MKTKLLLGGMSAFLLAITLVDFASKLLSVAVDGLLSICCLAFVAWCLRKPATK